MGRAGWWFIDEGPATKRLPHPHSPPQWRCRPLEIWAGTGPRVWSRTGWGDESDTALLCCTPLVRRPLRRFEGGVDEKDDGDDDAAGKMLLRLGGDEQMRPDLTPEKKRKKRKQQRTRGRGRLLASGKVRRQDWLIVTSRGEGYGRSMRDFCVAVKRAG